MLALIVLLREELEGDTLLLFGAELEVRHRFVVILLLRLCSEVSHLLCF